MSLPEDELSCPICCDIFTDPVLLACSHSFCRGCLRRYWDTAGTRTCPVCRRRASRCAPTPNLALKNLCAVLLEARRRSAEEAEDEERGGCLLHGERFKLFCRVDGRPLCVVCQASRLHRDHDCCPLEEAALDCKEELSTTLKALRGQLDGLCRVHQTSEDMLNHIKSQTLETQRLIQGQFEQLHQMLREEEATRLATLKREEDEKITAMKDKMTESAAEIPALRETIGLLEQEVEADDLILLQNFKANLERGTSAHRETESISGALLDVTKHLCNLKYRVWESMQDHIQYTPVTLDPNTAHPCLILSDDLTSLSYTSRPQRFPDNPERFHMSAEAVGMTALGSGSHHWTVETGSNEDWLLGVASSSAPRDLETPARPENGFWTLCWRDGEVRAMTSPPTTLAVTRTPRRIKVQLDYDKGTLAFFDCADDADDCLLFSFSHTFTETLLPYFYTQSESPLRILPENIYVTVLHR